MTSSDNAGLDAFDEHGNLTKPKEQAINKIGVSLSFTSHTA